MWTRSSSGDGWAGVNHEAGAFSDGLLRGGPLFRLESQTSFWGGLSTDHRKAVHVRLNTFGYVRRESGSWAFGFSPKRPVSSDGARQLQRGLVRQLESRR